MFNRAPEPLTPYFHPTTACFIDDNESFLAGLELMLPQHMNSVSFFDPVAALAHINQPPSTPALADRCFSHHESQHQSIFSLDIGLIEQEINLHERFNRISVVVVDYSMPTLSGLELCKQIKDPHIGRVLLTGVADEKTAVEAFNAGIIDRFISKSHALASERISEYSASMQQAYFRSQSQQLQSTLGLSAPTFLNSTRVAEFVRRIMHKHKFCEYYLANSPPGLLLVRPNGQMQQLLVLTSQQIAAQADLAKHYDAPKSVQRKLARASHIGFFLESPESYAQDDVFPWTQLLRRAVRIEDGGQTWYAALVKQPPMDIDYDPDKVSLESFQAAR